jgi:hypothetical protein
MKPHERRLIRCLQILGNIFFPLILAGIAIVELIDLISFKLSTMSIKEIRTIKACLQGCLFWIIAGTLLGVLLFCLT